MGIQFGTGHFYGNLREYHPLSSYLILVSCLKNIEFNRLLGSCFSRPYLLDACDKTILCTNPDPNQALHSLQEHLLSIERWSRILRIKLNQDKKKRPWNIYSLKNNMLLCLPVPASTTDVNASTVVQAQLRLETKLECPSTIKTY